MKKFWQDNRESLFFVFGILVVWRSILYIIEAAGKTLIEIRSGYLGPIPWANFDGVHYLSIAENGYTQYKEAFFPLFPMIVRVIGDIFNRNYILSGILVVHISFFMAVWLFWKLVNMDFSKSTAVWSIVFLFAFPTSFFFGSIYTESLFLMLILGSFYAARKRWWLVAGFLAMLATATRFVGIFLFPALIVEYFYQKKIKIKHFLKEAWGIFLIPLGLLAFMYYLNSFSADPFAFVHTQPAFGANRSGGEIILLPQVIFRYIKIFLTVPLTNYDFWIALLETISFSAVFITLLLNYKKVRLSYSLFSLLVIIAPTLTSTLSSMPRYILAAFPIFIILGCSENKFIKYLLLSISLVLLTVLTALFSRGYFVA